LVLAAAVNLWLTVSRPVCPGVRRPSGTCNQFFFLLEISFRQLRVCNFVAPSLTRGRVCKLLYNCFWALPERSLLCWSPAELWALFYCLIWDSTNLESQVPIFRSHVSAVRNFHCYHWSWSSSCGQWSVDQLVLVMTRCYLSLLFPFDSYFVVVPRAPSRTRGRVCSLQCNRWLVRSLTTNNHTLPSHLRQCSLFVVSYDSQGLRWKYSYPPPHGVLQLVKVKVTIGYSIYYIELDTISCCSHTR
jgi:hypothetical protein